MSSNRCFMEMLDAQCRNGRSLCVGFDSELKRIPKEIRDAYGSDPYRAQVEFNTQIIWQTHDVVCAFMANDDFYKAQGDKGMLALRETVKRAHHIAPEVPFILGAYGGNIGRSNLATIEYAFDYLNVDGITISPYFGQDALQPFMDMKDKGIIVLCRTSDLGASEFQDRISKEEDVPLYRTVAWRVSEYWNKKNMNCSLLFGAVSHGELSLVRSIVRHIPIFVTGIGPQSKTGRIEEDDVREIAINGKNAEGLGIVLCSSSGVIFSPNPRQEAERLHHLMCQYRQELAVAS